MSIPKVKEYDINFPLFTGTYNDFDPKWYKNIGITILFSMIINSFSGHIGYIVFPILNGFSKCFDSGCGCEGKATKKRTKREYMELYTGPDFDIGARYSEILFKIFVGLLYSSGMPFMYVTILVYLIINYWLDKFLSKLNIIILFSF